MDLLDFIQSETDIKNLNVVLTDLNGIFRGKKLPISQINKIPWPSFQSLDALGKQSESYHQYLPMLILLLQM